MKWAINVEIDGEQVVAIGTNMVSGRDLSQEEHQIACRALRNLAAFLEIESGGPRNTPDVDAP